MAAPAPVPPFVDTNVLLYLLSADADKAQRAEALLAQGVVISVQVLNEMAHVARRKNALGWDELRPLLADIRQLAQVQDLTLAVHLRGLDLAQRYQLGLHDAMIAAAAMAAGCDTLYSEDFQHGQWLEHGQAPSTLSPARALRIRNPFRVNEG